MELKLSSDDIKAILINWAQGKFPSVTFNDVEWSGYSYSREATLSYVEPEVTKLKEAA